MILLNLKKFILIIKYFSDNIKVNLIINFIKLTTEI